MKIYPNPAKDIITIEINKAGNYAIKIYTTEGKQVLAKQIKGLHKQNIEHNLPKGEYIVTVSDKNGNTIQNILVVE